MFQLVMGIVVKNPYTLFFFFCNDIVTADYRVLYRAIKYKIDYEMCQFTKITLTSFEHDIYHSAS